MTKTVGVSGTSGALAILLVWGLNIAGIGVPTEVAQAISTLVASVFTWTLAKKQGTNNA